MAIENTTVTRDLRNLEGTTANIYESISIIAKRANQIGLNVKEELNSKLALLSSNHKSFRFLDLNKSRWNKLKSRRVLEHLIYRAKFFVVFDYKVPHCFHSIR